MTKKFLDNHSLSIMAAGVAFLVLAALMLPIFATAQEGDLPPRGGDPPTATPVPEATAVPEAKPAPSGSRLQLHVHYGSNWPWHLMAWQELWTEVQWTDGQAWFVVEGWRGHMDTITRAADGRWVSAREWWVDNKDFNTGPFRWVVYAHEGGAVLATSDTFMLPARGGETMIIDQTVGE